MINSIVFIQRARAATHKGTASLTLSSTSEIQFNLDHPRRTELQGQWATASDTVETLPQTPHTGDPTLNFTTMINKLDTAQKGDQDPPPFHFRNDVEIGSILHDDVVYKGCATTACFKKVRDYGLRQRFCPKCQSTVQTFVWRFRLRVLVTDGTQVLWATAFKDVSA